MDAKTLNEVLVAAKTSWLQVNNYCPDDIDDWQAILVTRPVSGDDLEYEVQVVDHLGCYDQSLIFDGSGKDETTALDAVKAQIAEYPVKGLAERAEREAYNAAWWGG